MSREYGVIRTRYWTDPDVHRLSLPARLMGAYLLTSPHSNALGCYRAPVGYLSEDLRLSYDDAKQALETLEEIGFVVTDELGWIFLPNYIKHNPPQSPNAGKAAVAVIDTIPKESPLRKEAISAILASGNAYLIEALSITGLAGEEYEGLVEGLASPSEGLPEGLASPSEGLPEGLPTIDQDQDQEQKDSEEEEVALTPARPPAAFTARELALLWNEKAVAPLPRIKALTDDRRKKLRTRLSIHPEPAWWEAVIERVNASRFLRGDNERGWMVDFDWILSERNLTRIVEGKYDNRPAGGGGGGQRPSAPRSPGAPRGAGLNALVRSSAEGGEQ
ncbi:MAG: hypothetical protein P1V51_19915 [Deltaproteobacteria bacterium]|nr:hypothetical protein [Deltaproteobacteria bacterium]